MALSPRSQGSVPSTRVHCTPRQLHTAPQLLSHFRGAAPGRLLPGHSQVTRRGDCSAQESGVRYRTGSRYQGATTSQHHGQVPEPRKRSGGQQGLPRELIPGTGERPDSGPLLGEPLPLSPKSALLSHAGQTVGDGSRRTLRRGERVTAGTIPTACPGSDLPRSVRPGRPCRTREHITDREGKCDPFTSYKALSSHRLGATSQRGTC